VTPSLAYCLYACSARHTGTDWSRNYVSYPDGRVRRLMPIECERIQGFPENWTLPRGLDISDPDKIDTMRYNALGNAVTVPVAEWLAHRIGAYVATQQQFEDQQATVAL
jgi:DNA (cytosine-5)-methyltransferase 1